MVEELGQRRRVGGADLDGREVPAQAGRLAHGVERGARLLGDGRRDQVGALLEVAAVEGHEPERRSQLEVLLHAVVGEQLCEAAHYCGRRARNPNVAVSTAARPSASSRPSVFGPDVVHPRG